jgi:hypothetical protein
VTAADAGGAAPAPQAVGNGGPPPLTAADLPDEIAAQLPDGFTLPPGFAFVQVPEPTAEQRVDGAVEHASMQYALWEAARADLERLREHAEGQIAAQEAGADKLRAEWEEAAGRARRIATEAGVTLPEELPRTGAWTEPIPPPPLPEESTTGQGDGLAAPPPAEHADDPPAGNQPPAGDSAGGDRQ